MFLYQLLFLQEYAVISLTRIHVVVLYNIVLCFHERFIDCSDLCRNIYSHVRVLTSSLNMGVHTWNRDLVEVHHTHVHDIIHNLQAHHMRIKNGK